MRNNIIRKLSTAAAGGVLLTLALTGCGSGSLSGDDAESSPSAAGNSGGAELQKVVVGVQIGRAHV